MTFGTRFRIRFVGARSALVAFCCVLCGSPASLVSRADDAVAPIEVLQAYEDAVGQYWENIEISSSAPFSKVLDGRTVYLSREYVCLISDRKYLDEEKPNKIVYTIGSPDLPLMIRDVDADGGNEEGWSIASSLKPPKDAMIRPAAALWGAAVVGIFAGTTHDEVAMIPDLLREADSLTATRKTAEVGEIIVLNAEHSRGKFEVQLIPSKDYVLYRLDYTPSDLKPGRLRWTSTQFSDFFLSEGLWLPRAGKKTLHVISSSANSESISNTASDKILTVEIHLESLRRLGETGVREVTEGIVNRIVDGTRVRMDDASHLDYEWQDGKPVPVTPGGVEALQGEGFLGGVGAPRFWLVVIGCLFVVVFVAIQINDHRRRRATKQSTRKPE